MRILLSIKPQFAEKIFGGSKSFEFRKRVHKNAKVNTVVVYATKPVGKVVGEFSVSEVHRDSPAKLWKRTSMRSGISRPYFDSYFEGRTHGYAIEVGTATLYENPLDLKDVVASGCAPQSFLYLPPDTRPKLSGSGADRITAAKCAPPPRSPAVPPTLGPE